MRLDKLLSKQSDDDQRLHNDHPITGWPLPILADLDRRGARGLLADLAVAGALVRQSAFIVAIDADLDQPSDFLSRLGITTSGAAGVGEALRTRQARDVIAATYRMKPEAVPTGFLRALSRVENAGSDKPGFDPLVHCESYRRLFDIFTTERHGRKANALRFCGSLRSSHIYAAEHLAPALVYPEIVAIMDSVAHVERANALLDLIRASVSTITEVEIAQALKQSLRSGSILDRFARKALERADRLPEPPLPECEDLRPLRTAAEVTKFGKRMGNCASTKLVEIVLGLLHVLEMHHVLGNGTVVPLAVSLTPLTSGGWVVADVSMRDNQRPPRHILRAVLGRLQDLGFVVAGPALTAPYRQDVARLLGVHRWAPIDDCLRPVIDAQEEVDAVEALMGEIGKAA